MRQLLYILLIFLLLFFSRSFALTAIVQDVAGNPIEGVRITFALDDTVLYTNSTGSFNLIKTTPISDNFIVGEQARLTFKGNSFSLSLTKSEKVVFSLFNTRGQMIVSHSNIMSRGVHNIKLPELASGLYVIQASIGRESFTRKFNSQGGFSWAGFKSDRVARERAHRVVVDTVYFKYPGYSNVIKTIETYDEDLGTIIMAEGLYTDDWYGLKKFVVDTTLPNFVHMLFCAYDEYGYGIINIDTSRFIVLEDGSPITSESELKIEKSITFNDTIRTIMLLDNSKSVESNLNEIKSAAKQMVRNIAPHQEISVYVFSEDVTKVVNFSNDTIALINAIDMIPIGYSSTNLYGALTTAFSAISNSGSIVNKTIMFGNVVLFTDGKDTQGSKTLNDVLMAQGDKQVFSIGLGSELDTASLKQISGNFLYKANDVSELSNLFTEIQYRISTIANSCYWAHYRSPKRGNAVHTLEMLVDSNSNIGGSASINGTFNSALFQAGWAPIAESLSISINAAGDTLIGNYIYCDKDGESEGQSLYRWWIAAPTNNNFYTFTIADSGSRYLPISKIDKRYKVIFDVKPVSKFGSPNEGEWTAVGITEGFVGKQYMVSDLTMYNQLIPWNMNFLLSGSNGSNFIAGDKVLANLSKDGEFEWVKKYPNNSSAYPSIEFIDGEHSDDSLLIFIVDSVDLKKDHYTVITKCNLSGEQLWSNVICVDTLKRPTRLIKTSDNHYFAVQSYKMYKIDSSGDTLFSKSGIYSVNNYPVYPTRDGGIISFLGGVGLMKYDSNGDSTWSMPTGYFRTYTLTKDNDFVFITNTDVIKISNKGDTLWSTQLSEQLGGGSSDSPKSPKIINLKDGGYLIEGTIIPVSPLTPLDKIDFKVFKLNNEGEIQWEKEFGSAGIDYIISVIEDSDGNYLLSASTSSFGKLGPRAKPDDYWKQFNWLWDRNTKIWLIKLDENGETIWPSDISLD